MINKHEIRWIKKDSLVYVEVYREALFWYIVNCSFIIYLNGFASIKISRIIFLQLQFSQCLQLL